MGAGNFVKVFDVLESGYKDWPFPAFGLIFVAVGLVIFLSPRLTPAADFPKRENAKKAYLFFRYGFLGFAMLWTVSSFVSTYTVYLRHKKMLLENSCLTAEGPIENFKPMPARGHAREQFTVQHIPFSYSDFVVSDSFNQTASHGGPMAMQMAMQKDSYARICFDPNGNAILRLEIRDYQGPPVNFSKTQWPLPFNPLAKMPWYGYLFVIASLLDLVGLLSMFLPYLNTFIRLKTSPVTDRKVPVTLEPNRSVKLTNCLLYWDEKNRAIWLRPRGLNFFRLQMTAAKFTTDEFGKSITSQEIRFSSGAPIIMALMLIPIYNIMTTNIPAKAGLPPKTFVAIFAALMIFSLVINARAFTKRMEDLAGEALADLKKMP